MGICYIVGAGECHRLDFSPVHGDYVIAADGGLSHLERHGLTADLIVGDFDSLAPEKCPDQIAALPLRKEKDDTDSHAAVAEGIKSGYKNFHLYCCTGGRIEHTMANMQLLAYLAEKQLKGFLFGDNYVITAVTDGSIRFKARNGGYISVFSHTEKSTGVFLKGLKYELTDATVTNTFPIGVSNEFIGCESVVTVGKGTLLVVFPRDGENCEISLTFP